MARFTVGLIIMLAALSALMDRRMKEPQRTVTGTVRDWNRGESIIITSEQTDPRGFAVRLRGTQYEGEADRLAQGSKVTVWYRMVSESQPVAYTVRVDD